MMPVSNPASYREEDSYQPSPSPPQPPPQFHLSAHSHPDPQHQPPNPRKPAPLPVHSSPQPLPSAPRPDPNVTDPSHHPSLWKLAHLSLEDSVDEIHTRSPAYTPLHGYDAQVSSSFAQPVPLYAYRAPHSPAQVPNHAAVAAATAATAAAAVAAAAQHSPGGYSQSRTNPAEGWVERGGRKTIYEGRDGAVGIGGSYVAPNGSMAEVFGGMGATAVEDPLMGFEQPGMAYGGLYRENGSAGYPVARNLFGGQGQGGSGGMLGGRGRSGGGRVEGYGYGYGAGRAYGGSRGRAIPVTPEYLNAQAAAAAAAAAAAVYQSNGVHINGGGGFNPLRSGGVGQKVVVGRGGGGRVTEGRRGGDVYVRGVSGQNVGIGRNGVGGGGHDRGILERNGGVVSEGGGGLGGGTSSGGLKFSSFSDVVGRAEELARDQHGCRFLQTKLEEGNVVYINSIFEECYEKFVDLMTDPFGNYLCQKLFEYCNDAQRLALVERCAPAIPSVSVNMHGTRAVQRMVECLSGREQVQAICAALKPEAVSLMKDINGNHVIQRCLNRMDPMDNQFIYDAVANNCFELATHRHGCCVMQRCMDFASQMQKDQLAQQINANALPLVQNAFGNYVVQYVLEMNDMVYTEEIIRRLKGHLAELSMQKFSSNVVEKGLQLSSKETRRELIDELISDEETMKRLLHDAYGNYVIQRALQIAEGLQLENICEAIRPHLHSLKQSPYGKRIQAKIVKRMPKGIATLATTG